MKEPYLKTVYLFLVTIWPLCLYSEEINHPTEDPVRWEEEIAALEKADKQNHGTVQPVVFVGSSSIRLWESLIKDMAPVPVVQRGFGGAKFNDVVYYAERLVNVHKPSAVVLFAGTNDIRPGHSKSPETLLASYQRFVQKVRTEQPDLPVYYIAITPSVLRWEAWHIAQQTNKLIAEYAAQDDNLHVIDTGEALLGDDGKPDPENYVHDRLHLSKKGYATWTRIIRPYILPYEPAAF